MKTALTELIENGKAKWVVIYQTHQYTRLLSKKQKLLLTKRKQQISNAYENGAFDFQGTNKEVTNGDGLDYFEKLTANAPHLSLVADYEATQYQFSNNLNTRKYVRINTKPAIKYSCCYAAFY
jgi:hypothetical protein